VAEETARKPRLTEAPPVRHTSNQPASTASHAHNCRAYNAWHDRYDLEMMQILHRSSALIYAACATQRIGALSRAVPSIEEQQAEAE
jgi:hypothetical protein